MYQDREERYWTFGRERLRIPEIIERFKGPRPPQEYRVPKKSTEKRTDDAR